MTLKKLATVLVLVWAALVALWATGVIDGFLALSGVVGAWVGAWLRVLRSYDDDYTNDDA